MVHTDFTCFFVASHEDFSVGALAHDALQFILLHAFLSCCHFLI